jgi:hypothetical protein
MPVFSHIALCLLRADRLHAFITSAMRLGLPDGECSARLKN